MVENNLGVSGAMVDGSLPMTNVPNSNKSSQKSRKKSKALLLAQQEPLKASAQAFRAKVFIYNINNCLPIIIIRY